MQTSKKHYAPYVVVDTNILIRAILRPSGSDGAVYNLLLQGTVRLYYSDKLLYELKRVIEEPRLKRKYEVTDETIHAFIHSLLQYGTLIQPIKRIELCRDPDDNELLSIATSIIGSREVYLISADKDLLVLKGKIEGIIILTPQKFLKVIEASI